MKAWLGAAVAALLTLATFSGHATEVDPTKLAIETASGAIHHFDVEIANTPQKMMRGLMFREELPANQGMLFINGQPGPMSMWMKNTLIPLDIVFIASDGRIVNIQADAKPHDLTPRPSAGPVKGALEINGGLAAKLGIHAGDRVVHPVFAAPN